MSIFNLLFSSTKSNSNSTNIGLLILRVSAGLAMAFGHGLGKLPPSDGFIGMIQSKMGLPLPTVMAWLAGLGEFLGGLFMALGIMTRPSALFMAAVMFMATFNFHLSDPFAAKEKALLFLIIGLTVVFTGPGKYSLDEIISNKK
ncbi:MAG: DoxX family protein [Bacteriovoracaceae bacterium]